MLGNVGYLVDVISLPLFCGIYLLTSWSSQTIGLVGSGKALGIGAGNMGASNFLRN